MFRSQISIRRVFWAVCFVLVSSLPATKVWAGAETERLGPPLQLIPLRYYGRALAVPDNELDGMRGGFRYSSGLVVEFGLSFWTKINGQEHFTTFTETDLMEHSGVVNSVIDDEVTVELTNDIIGVMNVIQNNLDGASIANRTTLSVDVHNLDQAIQTMNARRFFDSRSLLGF